MARIRPCLLLLPWAAAAAGAAEVCDLVFTDCAAKRAGTVLEVPPRVVSVDPRVPGCGEAIQKSVGGAARPLSIVFVIDESGSMQTTDTGGARLTVPAALLDEIHAFAPHAEVGLVAFSGILEYDSREHPYAQVAFPGDPAYPFDAYVPLTRLDRAFPDGRTGLDTLKAFLKVEIDSSHFGPDALPWIQENLLYGSDRPAPIGAGGTDITLGMEAAKVALRASTARPEDRYVIFLSDGDASSTLPNAQEFQDGLGMPTTFTVYFTGRRQGGTPGAVPQSIVSMTANIRANGYSASNPRSAYWGIDRPASELRTLLENNILGQILVMPTQAKEGRVTVGATPHATTAFADGRFVFGRRLPLAETATPFDFAFTFSYADTSGPAPVVRDTVTRFALTLRRRDGAILPPGTALACREQASLSLHHGGAPLAEVTSDHARLEVRLTPPPGAAPCAACVVAVSPHAGADREAVAVAAAAGAGHAAGTFPRALAAPAPGDGALQHAASDSLILAWHDPEVPLDRIRAAYPFRLLPPVPPPVFRVLSHNTVARTERRAEAGIPRGGGRWVLVAPAGLAVEGTGGAACCRLVPGPLTRADSAGYVGLVVEASREFEARLQVFSNLGVLVDGLAFRVTEGEFAKLPAAGSDGARRLGILWDGRAADGAPAGTGAFVLRTSVTLAGSPGRPPETRADTRRIGVLRGR